MTNTIDRLTTALTGNPSDTFWVLKPGEQKPAQEPVARPALQAMVDGGFAGSVCKVGETTWKSPADYGVIKTVTATVVQSAPPAAPAAPPAPPAAPTAPAAPAAPVDGLSAVFATQTQTQPQAPANPPAGIPAPPTQAVVVSGQTASAPVAESGLTIRELPQLVTSEEAARQVMATLFAPPSADRKQLSAVVDAVVSHGGMSFALPFAIVKEGGWEASKDHTPAEIFNFMPVGNRDFLAIFLAMRIGATGWKGAGSKGKTGSPPLWRFCLPHLQAHPDSEQLVERTMSVASKIQFTKSEQRTKYDEIGRLAPDIQILAWTPETKFILLVGAGFTTVRETLDAFRSPVNVEAEGVGKPILFTVAQADQVNKKVQRADPTAKNAAWQEPFILPKIVSSTDTLNASTVSRYMSDWQRAFTAAPVPMANTIQAFLSAADFEGLPLPEISNLLARYQPFFDEGRKA